MNNDIMDGVAQELLDALEKKDKSLLLDALRALIQDIRSSSEQD